VRVFRFAQLIAIRKLKETQIGIVFEQNRLSREANTKEGAKKRTTTEPKRVAVTLETKAVVYRVKNNTLSTAIIDLTSKFGVVYNSRPQKTNAKHSHRFCTISTESALHELSDSRSLSPGIRFSLFARMCRHHHECDQLNLLPLLLRQVDQHNSIMFI